MNMLKLLTLLTTVVLLTACATSNSGSVYSREQARQTHQVQLGVIAGVRPVTIEGTKSPIGAIGGAAIGGIAGSSIGGGRGSDIMAVLGGIGGWIMGASIEEAVTQENGVELTVKLDNGTMIAVVQEAEEAFAVGERVQVLTGAGATRVRH